VLWGGTLSRGGLSSRRVFERVRECWGGLLFCSVLSGVLLFCRLHLSLTFREVWRGQGGFGAFWVGRESALERVSGRLIH